MKAEMEIAASIVGKPALRFYRELEQRAQRLEAASRELESFHYSAARRADADIECDRRCLSMPG